MEKPEGRNNLQNVKKSYNTNIMKNFVVKHWKKIIVVFIVLFSILFFVLKNKNKDIKMIEVQKGNLKEEMVLSGDITATNYAKLSFETSGKVIYVGAKEGDSVAKGKLISKLDTTVLNSSYQIALSNLRLYEATVANIHDQVKDHTGDETFAQKDLRTTAEVNKDKAYEAVVSAKRNLDGASLYAPFNGVVTYLLHPFVGVYTSLAAVEAEVIDPSTMYLSVLADQTEVTKLKNNQDATIILDSFDDKEYEGIVSNISFVPKPGESGSIYAVKVSFKDVDLLKSSFKIGMTGDVKFVISEKNNITFVPNNFIKQDKNGSYVKTDKKGTKVYITTGIESEDNTEIIGDIKEGQILYD